MFEVGKSYTFSIDRGEGVREEGWKVLAIEGPLLRLGNALIGEMILNTTSTAFVLAQPAESDAMSMEDDGDGLLS